MQTSKYYRDFAARARRLSSTITDVQTVELLDDLARDFDEIALDLDNGAVEIVHPERLPQQQPSD